MALPPAIARTRMRAYAEPLFTELADALGRPLDLEILSSWPKTSAALMSGESDLALVTSSEVAGVLRDESKHAIAKTASPAFVAITLASDGPVSIHDTTFDSISLGQVTSETVLTREAIASGRLKLSPTATWHRRTTTDDVILDILQRKAEVGVVLELSLRWLSPAIQPALRTAGRIGESPGAFFIASDCISAEDRETLTEILVADDPSTGLHHWIDSFRSPPLEAVTPESLAAVRAFEQRRDAQRPASLE